MKDNPDIDEILATPWSNFRGLRENNYEDQEIYSKEKLQEYSTGLVLFPEPGS